MRHEVLPIKCVTSCMRTLETGAANEATYVSWRDLVANNHKLYEVLMGNTYKFYVLLAGVGTVFSAANLSGVGLQLNAMEARLIAKLEGRGGEKQQQ